MKKTHVISAHLLVRWLERVEGLDMALYRRAAVRMRWAAANDRDLIEFMEAYSAVDFERIRAQLDILLARAVAIGADCIRHNGIRLPIGSGRVGKSAVPQKKLAHKCKLRCYGDVRRTFEKSRRRDDEIAMQEARISP